MDADKLNQALYDKMAAEQDRYRHMLLGMTPEQVLDHAYEYATRQDILMEMEVLDLPAPEVAALLRSDQPLADIYGDLSERESRMDIIREGIETLAHSLVEAQWEKTRGIPLYPQSGAYAREHGELEAFRASRRANIACKDAIEAAIQEGFDGMFLTADTKGMLAEFGPERVSYVLAATLQTKEYDQRFSYGNQIWAEAIPMFEAEDRRSSYIIDSHSVLLNEFVNMVRSELDTMRGQPEKKPSIKAQLAAKPTPDEHPAKPKDREVR